LDCATGNGQAAVALSEYFDKVIATDASAAQIKNAIPHKKVSYFVATAEKTDIQDDTVDLITVAQALHWLEFDKFYDEVRRVARPKSVFAAWCYPLMQFENKNIQELLEYFYNTILGKYWPPERIHCDTRYENIPFPFQELKTPDFEIKLSWSQDAFIGYLSTWSAVQKYINKHHEDPIKKHILPTLSQSWGPCKKQSLRFDFIMRAGMIN